MGTADVTGILGGGGVTLRWTDIPSRRNTPHAPRRFMLQELEMGHVTWFQRLVCGRYPEMTMEMSVTRKYLPSQVSILLICVLRMVLIDTVTISKNNFKIYICLLCLSIHTSKNAWE